MNEALASITAHLVRKSCLAPKAHPGWGGREGFPPVGFLGSAGDVFPIVNIAGYISNEFHILEL